MGLRFQIRNPRKARIFSVDKKNTRHLRGAICPLFSDLQRAKQLAVR